MRSVLKVSFCLLFAVGGISAAEKLMFEKETLSSINQSQDVTLNETTVTGSVNVGGSFSGSNCEIQGSISAGKNVTLWRSSVLRETSAGKDIVVTKCETLESLSAGKDVTLLESNVRIEASAGKDLTAAKCESLGSLSAGKAIYIKSCPKVQSLFAGKNVVLHQSRILGDVSAGCDVNVEDSQIEGKLTCLSNHLILNGSQMSVIELKCVTDVFVKKEGLRQVLELSNCTVKDIIFEGNNGEVVLLGNSTVTGTIVGGKIRSKE